MSSCFDGIYLDGRNIVCIFLLITSPVLILSLHVADLISPLSLNNQGDIHFLL